MYQGSSPRMRGAPQETVDNLMPCGIIPAYAGSTWIPLQMELAIWDHPRVCGEHYYDMSEDEAREFTGEAKGEPSAAALYGDLGL